MRNFREVRGVCSRYIQSVIPAQYLAQAKTVIARTSSLFITGPTGTGKTYLAAAIILAAGREINLGQFYHVPSILSQAMAEYMTDSRRTLNDLCEYPLIALDDLGMEKPTERTLEAIDIIIDRRYSRELPTVITSNFKLNDIARIYGDRVSSRISEMCGIIMLIGKDRRTK